MAKKRGGFITGDVELDAKLKSLSPKLEKKFVRGALRLAGKRVLAEFRQIVKAEAYDTGAYMRAATVRSMKRSRVRLGVTMHVDRDKLFAHRAKKKGKTTLKKQKDIIAAHKAEFDEMHYYPASLEFGYTRKDGTEVPAIRPQRRALYDNQAKILSAFKNDVKQLIAEAAHK